MAAQRPGAAAAGQPLPSVFGGVSLPEASLITGHVAQDRPDAGLRPSSSLPQLPSSANRPRPASTGMTVQRLPDASRTSAPNVHNLSTSSSGSTLRNTTEAFRRYNETTAMTIDEMGPSTMSREKLDRNERARAKAHTSTTLPLPFQVSPHGRRLPGLGRSFGEMPGLCGLSSSCPRPVRDSQRGWMASLSSL